MNRRLLPLIPLVMILAGIVTVAVPFLVDPGTPGASTSAAVSRAGGVTASVSPFGNHRFERLVESPAGVLYGIARDEGLLVSYDRGRSWTGRSAGLPQKVVYPFDGPRPRELTSLAIDPARPGRIAVTTPRELHVSEDGGQSWVRIPTDRPKPTDDGWPAGTDHFTAVAFDPTDPDGFLLGTSFGGFYATSDRGLTWTDPSHEAEFLRRGAGMYEEVGGLAWVPQAAFAGWVAAGLDGGPNEPFQSSLYDPAFRPMVVGEGFGGRVYLWNPGSRQARDLRCPGSERGEIIQAIWIDQWGGDTRVAVTTDRTVWALSLATGQWSSVHRAFIADQPPAEPDPAKRERLITASDRTGIYVSSLQATSRHIDRHLDFLVRNGLNSIVVDCKEDYGFVTYDSRLELPQKMGAIKVRFNLDDLLRKAHNRGIYVIGRVLVFKDRLVYSYDNYAHAVWDRQKNAPWANLSSYEDEETGETQFYQREHWTDPFDPFVTDYNISIARELQDRGVDEIQFDYIRFPTDGNLATAVYRHRRPGMNNVDALESFLAKARESIKIPISTDLYGFNSWHQMGTTNGQSIAIISRYVDVISPMFYPNHFPLSFMRGVPYFDRAARIYAEGTQRAKLMVGGNALIRPYVQAFLLRGIAPEQNLDVPQSAELLRRQLAGAQGSASSGYTLWNASNDYYMVTSSLTDYQPGR
jgi:hypothetical protein